MSIDPLKPGQPGPQDAARLAAQQAGRRAAPERAEPPAGTPPAARDTVEISPASKGLVDAVPSTGEIPRGTLSPERLREVLDRLRSGHYDRAEVAEDVAARVRADLDSKPVE